MLLYIKQKFFSWGGNYRVEDAAGDLRWHMKRGSVRDLPVYNAQGAQVASLHCQSNSMFAKKYLIQLNGKTYALEMELKPFHPTRLFHLHELSWRLKEDFWGYSYSVTDKKGQVVMRESLLFREAELYIRNPNNELLCVCVALAMKKMPKND